MDQTRQTKFGVLLIAALTAVGCYRQVPIDTATPAPATHIQAQVTDSGVVAMGNLIGGSAQEVEGVVVEATDREWKLSMLRVEQRGGMSVDWNREIVTFPRSALMRPSQKTLDKPKSWLLAGGIVAGAILAGQVFKSLGADDNTDNNPPPASILLLPFRFR